jgi:4-hydroxy-2-oxoheptanedioate aldolase
MRSRSRLTAAITCGLLALVMSSAAQGQRKPRHNRIIEILEQGKMVFGWFAPARTPEAAMKAAADPRMDFVFFNMEQVDSYRPAEVKAFMQAMRSAEASRNPSDHALMTRLPIFHADPAAARKRTAEMLNLGVHAIVFPDMESGDEARQALAAMRYAPSGVRPDGVGDAPAYWRVPADEYRKKADVYPINPDGELASVFIIESEKGIANSREITRERPTVAFPGPGTLRRVFKGDMAKVEQAIQRQLASCKEFNVPCGITAGPDDLLQRVEDGFRVIIIYDRDYPETITLGRAAAGRG